MFNPDLIDPELIRLLNIYAKGRGLADLHIRHDPTVDIREVHVSNLLQFAIDCYFMGLLDGHNGLSKEDSYQGDWPDLIQDGCG